MVNNVEIQTQGYRIHQNQNTFFYFAFKPLKKLQNSM